MSAFAEGFVTGFANTLADGVNERTKIARDYFQKQYELATTVGLENHRKVEQQVNTSVKTAKQLQQMGVPREVIMAVASQDPMGLSDFYNTVAQAQASGITIDQSFFEDFVQISEDFKAPDEDFYTFFKRALSPIQSVAAADPEGFRRDRKGGIFAALMGADPYGRAQRKLDETIVIDGLSASELARYGSSSPAGVENAPTVTYDYSVVKDKEKEELSISEINSIDRTIAERAQQILDDERVRGNKTITREEALKRAAQEARSTYASVGAAISYIDRTYGTTEITSEVLAPVEESAGEVGQDAMETLGVAETPVVEPVGEPTVASEDVGATTPVEEATAPVEPSPEAFEGISNDPIDPQQENLSMITIKGLVLTWYSNNPDGTVTYVGPGSEEYIFDPAEVRAFVKQFGTNFKG